MAGSLKLQLRPASPGDRHVSGRRRSGQPSPACPSCRTPMLCVCSLDTSDPVMAGTPADGLADLDLFVCALCSMYTESYFVDLVGTARVLYNRHHDGPFGVARLPYPVHGIDLLPFPPSPFSPELLREMYGRRLLDGRYHLVADAPLWGSDDQLRKTCRRCGKKVRMVAIIDSDRELGLERILRDGSTCGLSLNWVDDYYLMVTHCRACGLFGYHPARG